MQNEELKKIPAVDKLLLEPSILKLKETFDINLITNLIRNILNNERVSILSGGKAKNIDQVCDEVMKSLNRIKINSIKKVINATGIILNTNLGRAPLPKKIINEIIPIISGYSNLEFDLFTSKRGNRTDNISELINIITQAEKAEVVNNNAAAIILILKTYAEKKEVIISRGELIEIGGSFRLPEIMKTSGAYMTEVGTTNRTNLEDYERAINKNTRIILKAHRSNYYIKGFTEEVELKSLSVLAKKNNLILLHDIGSGLLKRLNKFKLIDEPDVQSSIKNGADLVTFSCDKLMGGPQAGIIDGRKDLITQISKSPLMRALRVDKITIAILSEIIKLHLNEDELYKQLPLFQKLNRSKDELFSLAEQLKNKLMDYSIDSEIIESKAQIGGGSLPHIELSSFAVRLKLKVTEKSYSDRLYNIMLQADYPIVSILREGNILFDILTVESEEIDSMAETIFHSIKVIDNKKL